MSSWLWACVLLITLQSTIYVKSSPLCIEADVPKKFCGEAMVDAITLNCRSYPSAQSKRSTGDALGVVDMCCLKECTLRILLENYCLNTKDFRPCPRTNHINQDQDIVQNPSIKQGNDIKPMQEPQKQPEADAKSAAKAHKTAEVGARLSNTILQEARVGIEENDQIESLYQSMPNSVSSYANSKDFNRYPKRFGRNIDDSSDED